MNSYYKTLLKISNSLMPYLTAYWSADNIATDVYSNNLGGVFTNPNYGAGKNNNAFDFVNDNSNRYVQVPDNDLLSFSDNTGDVAFTVNLWVKFTAFSSGFNYLISKRDHQSSGQIEWQITYNNYNNSFLFGKYSRLQALHRVITLGSNTPDLDTWKMLTVTSDGTKFGEKIYLDSVDITSSRTELNSYMGMPNTISKLTFGAAGFDLNNDSFKHRGLIDEIAIFNGYELNQAEITNLYNLGNGKFYPNI